MDLSTLLQRQLATQKSPLKSVILQTSLDLFNVQGIESTTIEEIRVSAQASVGAIYHHFKNKEGLIAQLFFLGLNDQHETLRQHLNNCHSLQATISAIVYSYIDWVQENPEWARFQYAARFNVSNSEFADELKQRNYERNKTIKAAFQTHLNAQQLVQLSQECAPSLLIGSSENYCKAWLSKRVKREPTAYREVFAHSAWLCVQDLLQPEAQP